MPALKNVNQEDVRKASKEWEDFFAKKIANSGIDPFLIDRNIDSSACIMCGKGPELFRLDKN